MNAEEIDDKLNAIFFNPVDETRRRRIGSAIQRLESERRSAYDRAFPIGGTGKCLDGNLLVAVQSLDAQILELKSAKAAAVSGAPTVKETAESARSAALPMPTPLVTKDVKNPLNSIDIMPSGDALKNVAEQASDWAVHYVTGLFNKFRSAAGNQQNETVAYTQGEFAASRMALAAIVLDYRGLFKIARARREAEAARLDNHVKQFRALSDTLLKRIHTLEQRPIQKYCGVWVSGEYTEANTVTHQGGVFYCNRKTTDRPGTSDSWTLMLKRGDPAK